jgi:CPA1 family monovalent cation:H+ antiporter
LAFGLSLLPCLTFGALISATDPIAVVALFREVGAPPRLSTLIEGESLLNDGTAMVLFRIFMTVALASVAGKAQVLNLDFFGALWKFSWLSLGSIAIGLGIAGITSLLLRILSLSGAAQLGIIIVSAYLSFLISDAFLHLSGVISTLVVGLYLGQRIRLELNKEAFNGIHHILELLALSANTLVFLAVGLIFDPSWLFRNIAFIPLTLLIVYAARAISIALTIPTMNQLRLCDPISLAYQTVLMWGGLRGGLALGLVLTLPIAFPYRDLFIALSVSVVLTTLIINALTTRKILRLLQLDQLSEGDELIFQKTLPIILNDAYSSLKKSSKVGDLSPAFIEHHQTQFANPYSIRASSLTKDLNVTQEADLQFEIFSLLSMERQAYEVRLQEGRLSKDAYIELTESVKSRSALFSQKGTSGLRNYDLRLVQKLTWLEKLLFLFPSRSADRLLKRLVIHLEFLLNLRTALEHSKSEIKQQELNNIYDDWLKEVEQTLIQFYRNYAHYYNTVQSLVISQAHHAISLKNLWSLYDAKVISQAVYAKLKLELDSILDLATTESRAFLRPSASYLLGRIPLFQYFSRMIIRKLVMSSPVKIVEAERILVKKGDLNPILFVIVAGVFRLEKPAHEKTSKEIRLLFPGDYFGAKSLIHGEPQPATLVAEVTSEVLEITGNNLESIFLEYPILKSKILMEASLHDSIDTRN